MNTISPKLIYGILISLFIMSCSETSTIELTDSIVNENSNAFIRTPEEAAAIALQASTTTTRTGTGKTIKSIIKIKSLHSRNNEAGNIYAVNYDGNRGYVLVPARKDLQPVVALVDSGNYNEIEINEDSNTRYLFDQIKKYASQSPLKKPSYPTAYYDTIYPRAKVNPTVKVAWGQFWPENIYAPNGIAGCGPVAAAQILSAMRKPNAITYSFNERDINSETIDWSELLKHSKSYYSSSTCISSCLASESAHKTLGRIVREIGYRAYAQYKEEETSTYFFDVINVINTLSQKTASAPGNTSLGLYNSIAFANGSVVAYVRGTDNALGGHAWVADGAMEIGMTVIYYDTPATIDGSIPSQKVGYIIKTSEKYIHFNWGWKGSCNGYFLVDVFSPANGYQYDSNINWDEGNFKDDFMYVIYSI